jgi:GDP-4-dehydro-6-deoxy-D-mannose reductase
MRVLITGAAGFVGQHLSCLLLARGHKVYGTQLGTDPHYKCENVTMLPCDVRDPAMVLAAVQQANPEHIYHLAALSSVQDSFNNATEVYRTNFFGTLHLLDAAKKTVPGARILLVGSSQVYGVGGGRKPIAEDVPLRPASPYAVSKAAADLLGYQYFAAYKVDVVRARPFNHTGPGQPPSFVCSDFARQIAHIAKGAQEPVIEVGNVNVRRDISDVRDVVAAYELLLEKGQPGEAYNIGSGNPVAISEVIDTLISFCTRKVEVRVKRERLRANDPPVLYASVRKLQQATNWKREYTIAKTLKDMYDYWVEDVVSPGGLPTSAVNQPAATSPKARY